MPIGCSGRIMQHAWSTYLCPSSLSNSSTGRTSRPNLDYAQCCCSDPRAQTQQPLDLHENMDGPIKSMCISGPEAIGDTVQDIAVILSTSVPSRLLLQLSLKRGSFLVHIACHFFDDADATNPSVSCPCRLVLHPAAQLQLRKSPI